MWLRKRNIFWFRVGIRPWYNHKKSILGNSVINHMSMIFKTCYRELDVFKWLVKPIEWGIGKSCKIFKLSFLSINRCKELRCRNPGYVLGTKTKNKISGCHRPFRAPFIFCIVSRRFLRYCLNSSFWRSTFPIHLIYRNTELHGGSHVLTTVIYSKNFPAINVL